MKKQRLDFNIQLFTTNLNPTATFGKRLNETNAHEYFDMTLKDALYEEYNFEKYFDTVTQPQNKGKKMAFRRRGKYNLNAGSTYELTEGVIPNEDSPMETYEYELSLKNFGGFITFTDELDLYSIDSGESTALQRNQGYAVGELFQEKAYTILKSSSNHWFAGVDTTATATDTIAEARAAVTALDLEDFGKIKTFFKRNHVKGWDGGDYLAVISPEVAQTLLSLTKNSSKYTFIEIANYQQNTKPLYDGEIGRWNGFRFVEDTAIREINSTNPTVHACLILGKYRGEKGAKLTKLAGYGEPKSIIKPVTSGGATENPLNQKGSIGWKCMGWGGMVVDPEAVMIYECSAAAVNTNVFVEKEKPAFKGGYENDGDAITGTPKDVLNTVTKVTRS